MTQDCALCLCSLCCAKVRLKEMKNVFLIHFLILMNKTNALHIGVKVFHILKDSTETVLIYRNTLSIYI